MAKDYVILVTAATGIVSGYLLQILERLTESGNVRIDGRRVVIKASARSKAKAEKLAAERPGRGTVVLDFDKPREMKSAFEGVDSVFISTGYTGDMVHQTQWLIDAAREAGVTHCVHLGADTSGALRHYAHVSWHVVVESYITTAFTGPGLRWTHLHPGYFMANVYSYAGLPFFDKKTNTITSLLPPYGISPWIDNWDIADVGARCLLSPDKHAGKVYQLATQPFAIDEFCERVSKTLGKKIGFKVLSADELLEMVRERDPDDIGSLSYMMCISNMLKITQNAMSRFPQTSADGKIPRGKPPPVWPEVVRKICGREPMTIEDFARREARNFGVEKTSESRL